MPDKERLEEIKKNAIVEKVHFKYINNPKGYWGATYTLIDDDMRWLIQQAELGIVKQEQFHDYQTSNAKLKEQNQRYKQALKEAYSELQNLYSRNSTLSPVDKEDLLSTIEYVGLTVIKQALKGESEQQQ